MDRRDCLRATMYRGDLPVRTSMRGPVWSRTHFFWELPVRGCVPAILCARRLHAVSTLRRMPQAVRLQVHASASTLS